GSGVSVTALYEITPVGAAPSSDPLRYQSARPSAAPSGELAFLKVRYKLPGQPTSRLIERPITRRDASPTPAGAPEPTRRARAVPLGRGRRRLRPEAARRSVAGGRLRLAVGGVAGPGRARPGRVRPARRVREAGAQRRGRTPPERITSGRGRRHAARSRLPRS